MSCISAPSTHPLVACSVHRVTDVLSIWSALTCGTRPPHTGLVCQVPPAERLGISTVKKFFGYAIGRSPDEHYRPTIPLPIWKANIECRLSHILQSRDVHSPLFTGDDIFAAFCLPSGSSSVKRGSALQAICLAYPTALVVYYQLHIPNW